MQFILKENSGMYEIASGCNILYTTITKHKLFVQHNIFFSTVTVFYFLCE